MAQGRGGIRKNFDGMNGMSRIVFGKPRMDANGREFGEGCCPQRPSLFLQLIPYFFCFKRSLSAFLCVSAPPRLCVNVLYDRPVVSRNSRKTDKQAVQRLPFLNNQTSYEKKNYDAENCRCCTKGRSSNAGDLLSRRIYGGRA